MAEFKSEAGVDPRHVDVYERVLRLMASGLQDVVEIKEATARRYAGAILETLLEVDLDAPDGGWMFIQGQVHQLVESERVHDGEDRDTNLWAVSAQRNGDDDE